MKKPKNRSENEIKVFISNRESKCDECGKVPGRKSMSYTEEEWVDEDATSHRGPDD